MREGSCPNGLPSLSEPQKRPTNIVNLEIKEAGDARKVAIVSFDSEEITDQEKQVCQEFSRMANIPGFRKGKAPLQVIKKRYSKELKEELNRKVSTTAYEAVLEHKDIRVFSILKVDAGELEPNSPATVEVTVDVEPEFELPDYESFEFTIHPAEVKEEEEEKALEGLKDQKAAFEETDRAVAEKDYVKCSYEGMLDGSPVAEILPDKPMYGKQTNTWEEAGQAKGMGVEAIAQGVVGMKKDEKKEIEITFEEDFELAPLAGKKVIYSIEDKDPRSFNKSKKILKSNKITIKSGLLSNKVNELYKSYNYIKKYELPYITGKLACSSDLSILRNNSPITNNYSRSVSHLLRYQNQGILTSYRTVNSDNPKLTCRINGLEKFSPIRIVIDKDLKIKTNSYIVNNSKKDKTIIFHNSKNLSKLRYLKKKNINLINFEVENDNYFDLKKILKKIYKLGIHNLLIEGGKSLTYQMISKNLFNEFYLFKSNKILYSKAKIKVFDIKKNLDSKFKNNNLVNTYLDKDRLIHYY